MAVDESAGPGWRLRAVLAWSFLDEHQMRAAHSFDPDLNEEVARNTLAAAVERAVGADAAADIELEVICDRPASG